MTSLAADGDEYLEDGAGPRTPPGDNLVLDYARAEAAAYGAVIGSNGGRVEDDAATGVHLRDLGIASPFGNTAMLSHPVADAETEATVARIREFFASESGGPYLVFSPWRTTDWQVHGFQRVGHPPLMVRPPGGDPITPAGLDIVAVHDANTLADFERTLVEAFPIPELQPWQPGDYLHPDVLATPWRLFVGYDAGVPQATSAAFVSPTLTVVEYVSARPESRGRGFGAAMTSAAGHADPTRPSMLIASDDGQSIYERMGYLRLQRYTIWLGLR